MFSGSSADPGYFQSKEREQVLKPLLISAVNWRYAQRRPCTRALPRYEPTEPEKRAYVHIPHQEIKTGQEGNPKPTEMACSTGTLI